MFSQEKRGAMHFQQISERFLTTGRPEGGTITAVEIIQREDGKWQTLVNVSWEPNKTFLVAQFTNYQIKLYTLALNAMRHAILKYDYDGAIIVRPKRGKLHKLHI
jgi:hypothetical protein